MNGPDVAVDEVGPRLIQGAFVGLSVGSQHVAAPSGGGNYGITPDATSYSTYVFAHGDLKTPAVTLKSGPYPSAVGFDPAAGLFYAQNSDKQLIVFDKAGNKLKEYALTDRLGGVQQFLVHPAGGKLQVLAGNHVFALDVPKP